MPFVLMALPAVVIFAFSYVFIGFVDDVWQGVVDTSVTYLDNITFGLFDFKSKKDVFEYMGYLDKEDDELEDDQLHAKTLMQDMEFMSQNYILDLYAKGTDELAETYYGLTKKDLEDLYFDKIDKLESSVKDCEITKDDLESYYDKLGDYYFKDDYAMTLHEDYDIDLDLLEKDNSGKAFNELTEDERKDEIRKFLKLRLTVYVEAENRFWKNNGDQDITAEDIGAMFMGSGLLPLITGLDNLIDNGLLDNNGIKQTGYRVIETEKYSPTIVYIDDKLAIEECEDCEVTIWTVPFGTLSEFVASAFETLCNDVFGVTTEEQRHEANLLARQLWFKLALFSKTEVDEDGYITNAEGDVIGNAYLCYIDTDGWIRLMENSSLLGININDGYDVYSNGLLYEELVDGMYGPPPPVVIDGQLVYIMDDMTDSLDFDADYTLEEGEEIPSDEYLRENSDGFGLYSFIDLVLGDSETIESLEEDNLALFDRYEEYADSDNPEVLAAENGWNFEADREALADYGITFKDERELVKAYGIPSVFTFFIPLEESTRNLPFVLALASEMKDTHILLSNISNENSVDYMYNETKVIEYEYSNDGVRDEVVFEIFGFEFVIVEGGTGLPKEVQNITITREPVREVIAATLWDRDIYNEYAKVETESLDFYSDGRIKTHTIESKWEIVNQSVEYNGKAAEIVAKYNVKPADLGIYEELVGRPFLDSYSYEQIMNNDEIAADWEDYLGVGSLLWPMDEYRTISPQYPKHWPALDFGTSGQIGIPVRAVKDGVVWEVHSGEKEFDVGTSSINATFANSTATYGNYVILYHESDGTFTMYAHLTGSKGYPVDVGESVVAGTTIGYSGHSGRSSAPHLHFECRKGTKSYWSSSQVDVERLFSDNITVPNDELPNEEEDF